MLCSPAYGPARPRRSPPSWSQVPYEQRRQAMTLRFATKILLTSALTAVVGLAIVSGASAMRNDSDPFNLGYRGEVSPAVSHSERLRILVAIAAKNNKAAKKTVKAAAWSFP